MPEERPSSASAAEDRPSGAGGLRSRVRAVLGHPVTRNALYLYGVQAARYLVPLATVPYLARVLGPPGFGMLAVALSFAALCSLVVEYGFNYSATREIARCRDDPAAVRSVAAGVLGAKCLLVLALGLVSTAGLLYVGPLRFHPAFLLGAAALAAAQGFSAQWFFQGVERMGATVIRDLAGRVLAAVGIFALVHGPGQAAVVLWLWAVGAGAATCWDYVVIRREVGGYPLTLRRAVRELRSGVSMFLFRGSAALYTSANALLLGFFLPAAAVADFAGADKAVRAAQSLLVPAGQALFPRMSSLMWRDERRGLRVGARLLIAMTSLGLAVGGVLALAAPLIVRWLLGRGYVGATALLRVMAGTIPLVAVSNVLGLQLMIPLAMDRAFNAVIMTAGAANLVMALVLVPRLGAMGMAVSVVASEVIVIVGMALALGARLRQGAGHANRLGA